MNTALFGLMGGKVAVILVTVAGHCALSPAGPGSLQSVKSPSLVLDSLQSTTVELALCAWPCAWKYGVYFLFLLLRCHPLFPAATSPPSFPGR